jgi:hypothetical protein
MRIFLFCLLVVTLSWSCKDRQSQIPYVQVNLNLNINEPQFFDLSVPTGYVYITGGSLGIIVYRMSEDEFVAIERHSPYNPEDGCRVEVKSDGVIIEDPCSDSEWLIHDGSIVSGPTNFALTTYNTSYNAPYLYIYN